MTPRLRVRGLAAVLFALVLGATAQATAQGMECRKAGGKLMGPPTIVYFGFDSVEILPAEQSKLTRLAERMSGNPSIEICLVGQTDKVGNVDYNRKLAQRRVDAVQAFLKANGLDSQKYQEVVRGEAFGNTWVGRLFKDVEFQSDRRVEVTVIQY